MTKKENALAGAIKDIAYIWNHRKGNEIPAAVQDTIEALWADNRPFIHVREKQENGWFFVIHLPPGRSYAEFKAKQQFFQDATGGAVQITKEGKAVKMTVLTNELARTYPYQWDYDKHSKMYLPFPVGHTPGGFVTADFGKVYYILNAGHPGAGKSAWLHQLITSLLLARDCWVIIIDRKKLEYGYLRKHCMVVTSMSEARTVLAALANEGDSLLDKRLDVLAKHDVIDIQDLPYGVMKPVVLVIDELAELDDKECMEHLNRYVRLGRAAGLWGIAATQRPSAKLSADWSETKALFPATACFHVRDELNSRMVLGNDRAALIPNIPERGIWQFDEETEFQGMYLPMGKAKKLLNGVEGRPPSVESSKRLLPR